MRTLMSVLAIALVAGLARGEEVWRWKDAKGTLCYSNRPEAAPPEATPVKTRIIVETTRLPGAQPDLVMDDGEVFDAREVHLERHPAKRVRRIYSEKRLRFDCYAGSVLYSGGWAHPDDITAVGNCLPYRLGPEAWLNGARAELALRQHGIDWRQLVPMYLAQREWSPTPRATAVSERD